MHLLLLRVDRDQAAAFVAHSLDVALQVGLPCSECCLLVHLHLQGCLPACLQAVHTTAQEAYRLVRHGQASLTASSPDEQRPKQE